MKTSDFKSFNYLESGEVSFSLFDTIKSTKILDPGTYELSYKDYPADVVKLTTVNKPFINLFDFPEKVKLDDIFESFFNKIIKRNIEKVNKQWYNMKKQNGEKNEKNKWNNNAIL